MAYQSEKEIFEIVRGFENGTIGREHWRHAEHLTVACYYAFHHDFETALAKMRDGIFNLLHAFKVDLSKEMPYHETLTVFWMRTIEDFVIRRNELSFVEICNESIENFNKDYPLRFYSRANLFSDQARKTFVAPDL
jgi:elongation factor P--beta-lysine ligase